MQRNPPGSRRIAPPPAHLLRTEWCPAPERTFNKTELTLVRQYAQTVAPWLQRGKIRSSWSLQNTPFQWNGIQWNRGCLPLQFLNGMDRDSARVQANKDAFQLSNNRKLYKSKFSPLRRKAAGTLYPKLGWHMGPPAHAAASQHQCVRWHSTCP